MSDKLVVGPDQMPGWLEKRRKIMGELEGQLIRGLRKPEKGFTLEQLQMVVEHRNPFEVVETPADALVSRNTKLLSKKFGQRIEVDPLPPEFTEENLAGWEKFNLKPIFLPDEEIGENRKLKGWVKPERWFYEKIGEGKIRSDSAQLHRGWYLADFTVGVDYTDGTQVFPNDPLAPIIYKLREEKKAGKYDNTPLGSRFSITHDEWREVVCPAIAQELGFRPNQIRLERAIEFNAIGNLYDANRGKFNMWEWFDNIFEDFYRLGGGHRRHGGLAVVSCFLSSSRLGRIAGRPLVSFVK